MASLTRWTWVWVNSGNWWWTWRPGVPRFMGSQRVRHDWATDLIWSDLKITADCECSQEIKSFMLLGRKIMINLDSIKKQRHRIVDKSVSSQSCGFSSSHVWMWELDHKESWALKNWCLQTVVVEKTLESPLNSKENKPVNPKGNQPWIFIGRTDAEAEAPIIWLPNVMRRRQWQPTPVLLPGKSHGRRSLVGYSPWGR